MAAVEPFAEILSKYKNFINHSDGFEITAGVRVKWCDKVMSLTPRIVVTDTD